MVAAATRDIVVIGAGPAGVSAALSLRDRGLVPLLIDRADHVGASWSSRYDKLKLNTGRQFSHLPGRPYPKGTPVYPSRDDVVAHLQRHADEDGIDLALNTSVTDRSRQRALAAGHPAGPTHVAPGGGRHRIRAHPGDPLVARHFRRRGHSLVDLPEPHPLHG
jgi:NADPH-dependent 2,4-dienoyl-CoA reductase/sulfur reductase-like enzyme